MKSSIIGLFAGLLLGLGATQGFGAFLLVLFLGAIGLLVGGVVDGDIDLGNLLGGRGKDRR